MVPRAVSRRDGFLSVLMFVVMSTLLLSPFLLFAPRVTAESGFTPAADFAHRQAECEACKVFNEHLFEIFSMNGKVQRLKSEHSVCDDQFWHLSTNMHAHEFKDACERIESHLKGMEAVKKEYLQWPLKKKVDRGNHKSQQLLVQVKRKVCVETIGVCGDSDIPGPLDRRRTPCETCDVVVKSLAGHLARYENQDISDYRREGLLEEKMATFCKEFDKEAFDDPGLKSTADIMVYCTELVRLSAEDIKSSFNRHKSDTGAVLRDVCPRNNKCGLFPGHFEL
uniref:Uncharacterized protein n=1 Tax=Chloropicon laureae TaxID=464258 RepID=A0A7S2Z1F2_9CHLO